MEFVRGHGRLMETFRLHKKVDDAKKRTLYGAHQQGPAVHSFHEIFELEKRAELFMQKVEEARRKEQEALARGACARPPLSFVVPFVVVVFCFCACFADVVVVAFLSRFACCVSSCLLLGIPCAQSPLSLLCGCLRSCTRLFVTCKPHNRFRDVTQVL
jgi:hypothetical protein